MQVVLLEDVMEGVIPKITFRRGHKTVVWEKGAVIEMSDASAQKYIAAGKAEEVKPAVGEEAV